jgi:hypothetical protein
MTSGIERVAINKRLPEEQQMAAKNRIQMFFWNPRIGEV